jgi:hypothetical protein
MFNFASFTPIQLRSTPSGLILCLGLLVNLNTGVAGQMTSESDLFLEQTPLEMDLFLDTWKLCREQDQSRCKDISTRLVYTLDGQDVQTVPLLVKARGKTRLESGLCSIPLLFLVFEQKQTSGTLFAGQDMLPLTTHCGAKSVVGDDYLLKEYLAYRIFNLFSEISIRVRLASIRYRKSENGKRPNPHYAFFNEHFLSVSARNGVELWNTEKLDPALLDPMAMASMELFQYMIGNTDFSAFGQHNIALLKTASGRVIPLPYDFDYSGLVYAKYGTPSPGLGLTSQRQRLYRGICHPELDWDLLFQKFIDKREPVFSLLDSTPGLSRNARKSTHRYLRAFFEILESPEQRKKKIVDACRMVNPVD